VQVGGTVVGGWGGKGRACVCVLELSSEEEGEPVHLLAAPIGG